MIWRGDSAVTLVICLIRMTKIRRWIILIATDISWLIGLFTRLWTNDMSMEAPKSGCGFRWTISIIVFIRIMWIVSVPNWTPNLVQLLLLLLWTHKVVINTMVISMLVVVSCNACLSKLLSIQDWSLSFWINSWNLGHYLTIICVGCFTLLTSSTLLSLIRTNPCLGSSSNPMSIRAPIFNLCSFIWRDTVGDHWYWSSKWINITHCTAFLVINNSWFFQSVI